MLEACVVGCRRAVRVVGNIVALSISFLGCIKTCESLLASLSESAGLGDVTLETAIGYMMTPLSLAIGVSSVDSVIFGRIVGVKIVSNEVVAYITLIKHIETLQRRTVMLATFALCGFGNLCSVGIALGTLGALCPERLSTVAGLGFRAMWAGCISSILNACVVGFEMAQEVFDESSSAY
ncbi:putative transporter YutK [Dermacentor variabilis]|uniref:putative transporter YutK n=1 Tax=Dermacentor variabilis TaxID=34621 RepID=UPI003F5C7E4D